MVLTIVGLFFAGIPVLSWIVIAHMEIGDRRAKATCIATDCVIQEIRRWQATSKRTGHVSDEPFDVASIRYEYEFLETPWKISPSL